MRRAVARRMTASKQRAPRSYVMRELCVDAAVAHVERRNANRTRDRRVSTTALVACAAGRVLATQRSLNAAWDGEQLVGAERVNLGIAIALGDGLVAPAVLDADTSSLDQTTIALRDLVSRPRAGRLRGIEVTDADHRTIDGADVARFLGSLANTLDHPEELHA